MKTLLVIIDGLGDDKISAYKEKTVYEYAKHPNLDVLSHRGQLNMISISNNDFLPESLACTLRLLGVSPNEFPLNRAYMELLANGRDISEYEMVLRCNLVSVDSQGCVHSFNGDGLSVEKINEITAIANSYRSNIEFIHLSGYRNLLVLDKQEDLLHNCFIKPPHESVGEPIEKLLEDICHKSLLVSTFINETRELLKPFAHDGITYLFYPWGQSQREIMISFFERYKQKGAVVCAAEIIKGIALALDLDIVPLAHATAEIDTDVREKAEKTVEALNKNDFVLTHFNGTDEAAHRYDYEQKTTFLERIDEEFFSYILKHIKEPVKIVVCADHATSSITGKHTQGSVPCISTYLNSGEKVIVIDSYKDIQKFLFARG